MLNKMNKIEIYVANEDTDINPSVQEAIKYVLKQNDPVGTIAGYYDEKLTIWSVSNYFLQLLGWDDLDEFMKASDGSMLSVVCNEQKHIFSPAGLHDLQGSHTLYLTDSKGLSIPVRIVKADARDNKGRPIWVLSVRSDHFARNQEAREAVFHRAFTDMNLCEYYVDLQENTFESMKVRGSLQEISNKSRTWDELIQMFLNNYVCPESKEAVAQIYNREYIMKELRKITGELSQEYKAVLDGELRIIRNVVMEGDTDENGEVRHAMIFLRDVTDSKNAEKERRAMLKQNIAMDQLIQGVTRIVERFAVCDLDSGIYEYYEMNNESYYNPTGDYRELLQRMSGEYVVLTEKINIQMDDLLSPEHLRKVIISEDDLYTFEYCTLDRSSYKVMSVIPVEWKGSILSKVMLIAQDIGQKHELEKLANTDALTGLYNERYLSERLKRNGKLRKKFAMFYLDLDRFKPVNDTYGHDMGDRLLKAVSRRLCKCIRKTDYAFRIGGDEFSLIIEEGNINDEFCEMMVRRIKSVIDRPFNIEGRLLSVDTSCGYAIYPEHSQKIDEIRIMADHRMYEDKTQNRKKG
ncbi:GGDEF domain-containing protein [Blautia wexlerae]|uniref:sensor domain-containing diguanylate cyclase n=1 Tax=Blautia TaxID=572511 RepID=UPI001D07AF86|nr:MULTISPECIES: GGDEF domain-containing protein [Blautia]MCB6355327.1 GGDEF domain-containing protein [Blautia wexlerae]MCB8628071.1 GGDEF domain-containing protein [Blautia sp. DFI.6.71]